MTGLSDLLATDVSGGIRLYSASAQGGGVLLRAPGEDLSVQDSHAYVSGSGLDAPRRLVQANLSDGPVLLLTGRSGADLTGVRLADDGSLGDGIALRLDTLDGGDAGAIQALTTIMVAGRRLFVTAHRHRAGLRLWEETGTDTLTELSGGAVAEVFAETDVFGLQGLVLGETPYLLALSAAGNSLTLIGVSDAGTLSVITQTDPRDGLFVDTPTHLETVTVAGQTYALVGAAASGSVAVVALSAAGQLRVVDQVNDDLNTRFSSLSVLQATQVDGQVYVVAGGADDGLSLMTLLPGGRLVHLETLVEDGAMALRDPSALSLLPEGHVLNLFVAGELSGELAEARTEANMGVTHLQADLGPIGVTAQAGDTGGTLTGTDQRDQLVGGSGDDVIRGGAGDDILMGGIGADTLWGGAGADVFVIQGDGWPDTIADFEPGTDRMDLSDLGRFYTLEALAISPERGGATIQLGEETLLVQTADGTRLTPQQLTLTDVWDIWHVSGAPLPATGRSLTGGDGADLLAGRDGPDTLAGGAAGDILQGQGGDDWLVGDARNPAFDTVSAQVFRLYQATLDRVPDTHGLYGWADQIGTGARDLTAVAEGFVGAPEFHATYGETSDSEFVTLLYQNVLDRAPDEAGLAGWTDRLARGTSRAEVVIGFSESPEFTGVTAAAAATVSFAVLQARAQGDVYRLYLGVLGREPDAAGFLSWTETLAAGADFEKVADGFVQAPEFRQRFQVPGEDAFVSLLYENVLGRAADADGLAHWVAQLESGGLTRSQVVMAFVQSPENRVATADACARWVLRQDMGDTLEGGAGSNVLVGGVMADRFVLSAGEVAHHTIVDLEPWDAVVFDGFGYVDSDDLSSRLVQQGEDVVFFDQGVTALFLNVTLQEIADGALLL